MVRHIGILKFKADISEQQIAESFRAMDDLVEEIPGLIKVEHGHYESNEGLNEDFTHGFIMTFDSTESRDAYLPHPIHEKFKELVVPKLERVIVFDFKV